MLALTGALERAVAAVEGALEERPTLYLTGGDAQRPPTGRRTRRKMLQAGVASAWDDPAHRGLVYAVVELWLRGQGR